MESQTNVGTDRIATTLASPTSVDFYVNVGGNQYAPTTTVVLPASQYRYVQVNYSLSGDWIGNLHQLRLNSTGTPAAFVPFNKTAAIPTSDETHSIIIDLTDGGTPFAGTWNTFRWDFFNDAAGGNGGGKTFTIDNITYATAITPIPEPGSAMLLGLAATGIFLRRRR